MRALFCHIKIREQAVCLLPLFNGLLYLTFFLAALMAALTESLSSE